MIEQEFYLKSLHLRPVRIHWINPKSKTVFNGPWVCYVFENSNILNIYHPRRAAGGGFSFSLVEAELAGSLDVSSVSRVRISDNIYIHGKLRDEGEVTISLIPYSDQEIVEAIIFKNNVGRLLESVKELIHG